MTVHLLGLAHTETTREFEFCAYTAKIRKLATMLTRLGVDVVLYAGEANEAEVAEHIPVVTRDEQRAWFPDWDPKVSPFAVDRAWEPETPWWTTFTDRAVAAIRERAQPGDVLGITMGTSHQPIADRVRDIGMLEVETGIGYSGVWAPYRVYESWAWRHYLATKEPTDDVRFFDEVIPNYFEPEAFPAGRGDGGYFLFMGRLTRRKGPHIAAEACKRLGAKLIVAGQGAASVEPGRITCTDGTVIQGDVEYAGLVGPEERAQLMGGAIATFVPTTYLEPFGGVSVESQMTGTPAIVSDWGGLTENVVDGVTGYRCSMLRDFVGAAERASGLDRSAIREHAVATWSTDVLRYRYADYLGRLGTLFGEGWYAT